MTVHPTSRLALTIAFLLLGGGLIGHAWLSANQWLALLAVVLIMLILGFRVRLPESMPPFNRSVIRTALSLSAVFVLISAHLIRIQVAESDAIIRLTAQDADGETIGNPRLANSDLAANRGSIVDRDGNVIAETVMQDGTAVRVYPDPTTAYIAGYYSPLLYGNSGLEESYDKELAGARGNDPFQRILDGLLNRPPEGASLELTLDAGLQAYATNLLGGQTGAVVVMDVKTGQVLVMVSSPAYDPNRLYTATTAENAEATAYWETLLDNPDSPLVLRANQGLYTPGSTFKTVTAAIGIDLGLIGPEQVFEDNGEITIDGRTLVEQNRPDDSRDEWTVREGLAWSLNVVFAQIGLRIGAEKFWDKATEIGFGAEIPFDLPVATSQIASSRSSLDSDNALADTAFGQGELQVTPLQMCMVAAMFANDGRMMEPYLVENVVDENGRASIETEPSLWRQPVSAKTAEQVEEMMVNAVRNGAVSRAQVSGYTIGGKTGTAETGSGANHSWFIGFIGEDDPQYAVAVTLEEGSGGLANAVDIGREVLVQTMESPPPGE